MKYPLCCGTRFRIYCSRMLKFRAEPLRPPRKKKLPRASPLRNSLRQNLPRPVQKGSRARSSAKATEPDPAGNTRVLRTFCSELLGRDSVEAEMFALG